MPKFIAITQEEHASKSWQRHESYIFSRNEVIAPLVADELAVAVQNMPVAFVRQGDNFTIAAVQGLVPGQNLLVSPTGQWLTHYVPVAYRYNPFLLLPDDKGELTLCMDGDSGLVRNDQEGEPFFDIDGAPTEEIKKIFSRLVQLENGRKYTRSLCNVLTRLKLIQPWPITLTTNEGTGPVEGLFRIDEPALNNLTSQELLELRDCGALPVIYCQLLSMQHLGMLQALYTHRMNAEQKTATSNDTFSFAGLT